MDATKTKFNELETNFDDYINFQSDNRRTEERLNTLLSMNSEQELLKNSYRSEKEKLEAELIAKPVSAEKAFSYFGLMLGTFPPAAFFANALTDSGKIQMGESWIIGLLLLVNIGSALTGYFSGRLIGKIIVEMEKLSWHWMLLALPFIGLFWGIITGGIGGIFLFVIGAVFGAIIGGAVGTFALPLFTILHRIFKRGEIIDQNIFLPLSFGITLIISAFILGL